MNVLIIRNYPSYMSVKNNTYNIQEVGLAKALVRRGNRCDIIFWTDKNEETIEVPVSDSQEGKVIIYYKNGKTALKNTLFIDCKDLFSHYDVLQPCEYNQIEAWMLARKYPDKTVIYHGPYYSSFNKRYNLMCKVFDTFFLHSYKKRNTQFIAKSELAKDFLKSKGLQNIDIAGVGIDAEMLVDINSNYDQPIYQKMKSGTAQFKLLYVGKFEERRNIPFVFEVFKRVNLVIPDSMLYMVGTGEKTYIDHCWEYAKDIGIFEKIEWQERIEQKYLSEVYKLSDCFILSTYYEIFGMVLLEAMYYKTLVITNKNGGSSTLIEDGINGLLIDSWEPEKWAEKIIDYLQNPQKREQLTKRASETIEESFTWDKLAPLFEKYYEKKIEQGAK